MIADAGLDPGSGGALADQFIGVDPVQGIGRQPAVASDRAEQRAFRIGRQAEGATLKELAKSYNVGRATISRLAP